MEAGKNELHAGISFPGLISRVEVVPGNSRRKVFLHEFSLQFGLDRRFSSRIVLHKFLNADVFF